MKKSLEKWYDTDGNEIHAHGGCVLEHEGFFYWYGEYKVGITQSIRMRDTSGHTAEMRRLDFSGVSCYRSENLYDWEFRGIVLKPESDENSLLHRSRVVERPKVLYNAGTKKFIMHMHADSPDYSDAMVGAAECDSPDGSFVLAGSFRPCGCESRDMTTFRDDDGCAYLFHSSEKNRTMHIVKLTEDYLGCQDRYIRIFEGQSREAPAVFKKDGRYYCITSGCSGWAPNEANWAVADHAEGPWELKGNPCIGANAETTFLCQSAFVFFHENRYFIMFDKWNPQDLSDSRYLWLEVEFDGCEPFIAWKDHFSPGQRVKSGMPLIP